MRGRPLWGDRQAVEPCPQALYEACTLAHFFGDVGVLDPDGTVGSSFTIVSRIVPISAALCPDMPPPPAPPPSPPPVIKTRGVIWMFRSPTIFRSSISAALLLPICSAICLYASAWAVSRILVAWA